MQNSSWEWTGVPNQQKRIYRTYIYIYIYIYIYRTSCKTQQDEGTRGKNRSVSRTGPALSRWGNWSRGLIPISEQLSESEEKYLRLRVKQMICGSLNEWEADSPCCSHTYPGQECRSPRKCRGWELEFRDCGPIPGQGCCWLQRDRLRGCEGGDCGGKCLWRTARQPWKQGNTAESRVVGEAITIASLSPNASMAAEQRGWPIKHLRYWTTE